MEAKKEPEKKKDPKSQESLPYDQKTMDSADTEVEKTAPIAQEAPKTNHSSKSKSQTNAAPTNIQEAADLIKKKVADALHKTANATISISRQEDNWHADVEVIEEQYLPETTLKSMNDILGLYGVEMDQEGNLLTWTKKKTYKRSQGL
jgi:hypothetical protein